jgi:CubicO group peptidase (beta-lactamase class C family)
MRTSNLVLVTWLFAACGAATPPATTTTAPAPAPPNLTAAAVDTRDLDAYFRDHFPADRPGVAVLIAKRGRAVFAAGYGLADLKTRAPITPRTLFNTGSITKTFVASAILVLAQRGQLSVDDPLTKYFEFAHPEVVRGIQLRHLLTHTSGLPDLRKVDERPDFYLTARDAENWAPELGVEALAFEPGTRFAYSNPAFDGLALIVEQVSGRPWQRFVEDEIFRPAGMTSSTITDGAHPTSGVAHGYVDDPGDPAAPPQELDYGEYPTFAAAGNGGVWSSVDDLMRYEHALASGAFLPRALVADARTVKTFPGWVDDAPPQVGWAWWITDVDGIQEIGHTGHQAGFASNYIVMPAKDLQIVYLMNDASGDAWAEVNAELHRWLAAHAWLD